MSLTYSRAQTALAAVFLGLEGIDAELRTIERAVAEVRRGLASSRHEYETWSEALNREEEGLTR